MLTTKIILVVINRTVNSERNNRLNNTRDRNKNYNSSRIKK